MLYDREWVEKGVELLLKFAPTVKEIIIGIENNKPKCLKAMSGAFAGVKKVTVKKLPSTYPQGGEKVLVYHSTGKIIGNGYTIKNVAIEQSGINTQSFGLFGQLSGATLENVTFDNVTALITGGTRMPAATFGLLAGTIQSGTTLTNVSVTAGSLKIAQGINLGLATGYSFGLLCGLDLGNTLDKVEFDISYEVVPDEYAMNQLTLALGADGNSLELIFE
jgi:hypothetical protein